MTGQEPRVVSFTINEPFDVALRLLRGALAREGLRIPCELSTSERIQSELGVGLRDSIVLYVDSPILLLEATVLPVSGSLYIPEPVSLTASSKGESTVAVRSIKPLLDTALPWRSRQAVLLLHERILNAIQSVGQREAVLLFTGSSDAVPA